MEHPLTENEIQALASVVAGAWEAGAIRSPEQGALVLNACEKLKGEFLRLRNGGAEVESPAEDAEQAA